MSSPRAVLTLIATLSMLGASGRSLAADKHDQRSGQEPARLRLHSVISQQAAPAHKTQTAPGLTIEAIKQSDLVFVGKVIKADHTKGFWSGIFACYKPVEFGIEQLAKGQSSASRVVVHEILLGPNERVLKSAQLSPEFYAVGRKLIIVARNRDRDAATPMFYIGYVKPYSDEAWNSVTELSRASLNQK